MTAGVMNSEVVMTRTVVQLKCHDAQRAQWMASAEAAGVSFSEWARRALDEQVGLERAVSEERVTTGVGEAPAPRISAVPRRPTSSALAAALGHDLAAKFRPDPR
jgi:hypothetical protein